MFFNRKMIPSHSSKKKNPFYCNSRFPELEELCESFDLGITQKRVRIFFLLQNLPLKKGLASGRSKSQFEKLVSIIFFKYKSYFIPKAICSFNLNLLLKCYA
uniref:Uncharacterized protein n=1 Tax=Micrurus corallinus TaxID=54390 RepID=A0A2D4FKK1_MICCO